MRDSFALVKSRLHNRMGLINPDVYVTNQGIEKTNTYISFYNQNINMRKTGIDSEGLNTYEVSAVSNIWWDQSTRESNKNTIACVLVRTQVDDNSINENLYTILYAQLKVMFPNAYDSVSVAEAPVAVVVAATEAPETVADVPVAPVAPEA